MEKSIYYTPDISEFHVGFEFEIEDHGYWRKGDFHEIDFYKRFDEYELRVKYLDKEDFESLGFKEDKKLFDKVYSADVDFHVAYEKGEYKYLAILDNGECIVFKTFYFEGAGKFNPVSIHLFRGKIKNKSELKKLLTQIGVL